MIAPVISLFASFVRHNDDKEIYTDYNSPVYDVMPSLFIDFANGSRAGSGFRLLKRCLRHALDPKAFPLMENDACLFINEEDGEMGLVLNNKVGESMKDAVLSN